MFQLMEKGKFKPRHIFILPPPPTTIKKINKQNDILKLKEES
jgi:hypothetical protein